MYVGAFLLGCFLISLVHINERLWDNTKVGLISESFSLWLKSPKMGAKSQS